jgi:hypothetical protein
MDHHQDTHESGDIEYPIAGHSQKIGEFCLKEASVSVEIVPATGEWPVAAAPGTGKSRRCGHARLPASRAKRSRPLGETLDNGIEYGLMEVYA